MSDERLQALGLPRREFLKRAAIGVFAAPLIVSFGLGGTAEAATGCFPNQFLANQKATTMGSLVIMIWTYEQNDQIETGFASKLRKELLDAEGKLLDGDLKASCHRLDELKRDLTRESGRRINTGAANYFYSQFSTLWTQMGCASC